MQGDPAAESLLTIIRNLSCEVAAGAVREAAWRARAMKAEEEAAKLHQALSEATAQGGKDSQGEMPSGASNA